MTGDGRGSGPHIKVTIDQVVVTGLGSADARRAVRSLDTHLVALFADPATRLPAGDASLALLRPRPAPARAADGAHLGLVAAAAIHTAVQGGGR